MSFSLCSHEIREALLADYSFPLEVNNSIPCKFALPDMITPIVQVIDSHSFRCGMPLKAQTAS